MPAHVVNAGSGWTGLPDSAIAAGLKPHFEKQGVRFKCHVFGATVNSTFKKMLIFHSMASI